MHELALELRDRWVGHRVDDLLHQVYIVIPDGSEDVREVSAVGIWRYQPVPTVDDAEALAAVARELQDWLATECDAQTTVIVAAAKKGEDALANVVQDIALDGRSITAHGASA